jgi:hypothetical protein
VIAEYVERLARELAFDPSLSRCVRREVEDHLWEAVAADATSDGREAERRAVASFGDPRVIAAQFAVVSLGKQARSVSVIALALITAVFVAMQGRLTWYAMTRWPAVSTMETLGAMVASIDRYAFWLSVLVGISAWVYMGRRDIPAAFTPEYRGQLRRFRLLCSVAAGALMASVISDGVLTSLRLLDARSSREALLPLFSMAVELACAGGLLLSLLGMKQRAASIGRPVPPGEGRLDRGSR